MSALFRACLPAEVRRGAKLGQRFKSAAEMVGDGWTLSNTPTFGDQGGIILDGTDQKAAFDDKVLGVQSVSFWVTLGSTTEDILKLSSTHSIEASAGTLTATGFSSPTIYIDGVATDTISTDRVFVTVTTATSFTADDIVVGEVSTYGELQLEYLKIWADGAVLTLQETLDCTSNSTWNWPNESDVTLQMRTADYDIANVRTLDSSGNGNHGTFVGTPIQRNGYIEFANGEYLTTTVAASASQGTLLLTMSNTNGQFSLMGFSGGAGRAYLFQTSAGLVAGGVGGDGIGTIIGGSVINTGGIVTVSMTWDGVTVRLFANGLPEYVGPQNGAPTGSDNIWIANINGASSPVGGKFYDSRVFDKALTPTQILDYHRKMMSVVGSQV